MRCIVRATAWVLPPSTAGTGNITVRRSAGRNTFMNWEFTLGMWGFQGINQISSGAKPFPSVFPTPNSGTASRGSAPDREHRIRLSTLTINSGKITSLVAHPQEQLDNRPNGFPTCVSNRFRQGQCKHIKAGITKLNMLVLRGLWTPLILDLLTALGTVQQRYRHGALVLAPGSRPVRIRALHSKVGGGNGGPSGRLCWSI